RGSLEALIRDNDFLKPVFTQEFINAYQHYKFETQVWPDESRPTAFEFKSTYSC
ncbi:MAG: type I glutamate--ammonia ligase, partial [Campylobacterota bacterium]|nr:type I glutamate--ammonia ligase [Campylobacterota bacterium]MEA3354834.1 type I glutamate--ammonia ligase [Campylobacterota bacterium]